RHGGRSRDPHAAVARRDPAAHAQRARLMRLLNILDRAIAIVSPGAALERAKARATLGVMERHYEAASHGARTEGWNAPNTSASAAMGWSIGTLRARAREMRRNDGVIKRAHNVVRNITVGTGITPTFLH